MPQTDDIDLEEPTNGMELHRVGLQFGGGGNIGLVFHVNGRYYEVQSISPAFEPVDDEAVLVRPEHFTAELEARLTRMVECHTTHAFGYQTLEGTLEMFILEQLHLMAPGQKLMCSSAWLGIVLRRGSPPGLTDEPADNLTLFHWKKAFAIAWRSLESKLQQ
jgi:hypothetical protein